MECLFNGFAKTQPRILISNLLYRIFLFSVLVIQFGLKSLSAAVHISRFLKVDQVAGVIEADLYQAKSAQIAPCDGASESVVLSAVEPEHIPPREEPWRLQPAI